MKDEIVVIDYGMGNLHSVKSAFEFVGSRVVITGNPDDIGQAQRLVLPGVGSFRNAMSSIRECGIDLGIKRALNSGSKLLGICLGFQLCGNSSSEDGYTEGLGLIDSEVEIFRNVSINERMKIPHVGFNEVSFDSESRLFEGIQNNSDFYFNHSYRMLSLPGEARKATCNYGDAFVAAFEYGNIFGTQFHPEKSQTNGLRLLANFMKV